MSPERKQLVKGFEIKMDFASTWKVSRSIPTKLGETIGQKASYAASLLTACKIASGNNLLTF